MTQKLNRRDVLKLAGALGSLGIFGLGYADTFKGMAKGWWAGEEPANSISGDALSPEVHIDLATGEVTPNLHQYVSNVVCVGCTTVCGVRVRVDKATGKVLRVAGNPYHALSADPFVPFETPILDSYRMLSQYQETGLAYRSTACARGNAVLDKLTDPYRVLQPLKRVGARGAGKWEPISFEQLVQEVVEGGNLFGEGQVDGLRAIRDVKTPLNPDAPELGPKSNQLAFVAGFEEGRLPLAQRFVLNAFGSINFTGHTGNCGLSMRAGYAALLGDFAGYPHLKPDFQNAEYIINIGTAPGNAGNPFKRQGKLVAQARSEGNLMYVVVDPVLTNADSLASGTRTQWVPVKPGTDAALVMGMIRWILENERFNTTFLSQPNANAAKIAGEAGWSNATHLVIVDPKSPNVGQFLRGSQLGLAEAGDNDTFVVYDPTSKTFVANTQATGPAELFYTGTVEIGSVATQVKTSLQVLKEESQKYTLDEYASASGVPVDRIVALAQEFTSHGRKAAADCHGGTMHVGGFYAAYSAVMLNALVGNLNWKGGAGTGGGSYASASAGPRYDLTSFTGKVKPAGARISRRGFAYEKTTEFKKKKEAGQNPYPAQEPWYPFSSGLQSEYIPSALNAYPYPIKALFFWNTNPLYGQSGLYEQARSGLKDPKRIPLIVSIDPFINETSAFADYIVPDSVLYETWGSASPWGAVLTKVSSLRWPAVDSPVAKTAQGDSINMESFLIALALKLGLPGFGEKAIPDMNGNLYPLLHPEDWHLRSAANTAYDGSPVPEASTDELALTGLDRIQTMVKAVLLPEEQAKVNYVLARGGRFAPAESAYNGDRLGKAYTNPLQIYNETVGTSKNSMTGQRFTGTPTWSPPALVDGTTLDQAFPKSEWPFQAVSTKSQIMSAGVIGAPRLEEIHSTNYVLLHVEDAKSLGIQTGDRVRITSPAASLEGTALVQYGIQRGVVGFEHGYGHWGLGAADEAIGNTLWHASQQRAAGLAINRLGVNDPSRPGVSTLGDAVVGSNARQGVPVKVEKL